MENLKQVELQSKKCANLLLAHPEFQGPLSPAHHDLLAQILQEGRYEHPLVIDPEFCSKTLSQLFWDAGYDTTNPSMAYISAAIHAVTLIKEVTL